MHTHDPSSIEPYIPQGPESVACFKQLSEHRSLLGFRVAVTKERIVSRPHIYNIYIYIYIINMIIYIYIYICMSVYVYMYVYIYIYYIYIYIYV